VVISAAGISSILLGFSRTFWLQGVSAEVYSLHLLLVTAVIFSFVRAVRVQESRWWLLFAFLVGLAFTNHMTTILLAPALLYWFFAEHGFNKDSWRRISALSIPFFGGLSVYLFLPVRASQSPLLNWGNPQSLESFWWHVTGKQFRVWMFSSGDVARKQLGYFFDNLTNEFHFTVLIIAALGAGALLFSNRRRFFVLLILLLSCIAYSVNYDIHDIDSYFLLAYLTIGMFSAFGIAWIIRRFEQRNGRIFAGIVLTGTVILHTASNWQAADQRGNYMVEDYTKNILNDLPLNAIVISSQWDYFVSASYYYQHVEKLRSDIIVLDKELFRRSWYFPQLEKMYPDIMQRTSVESAVFQKELYKFEHDLPYDYNAIEGGYTALLKSFMEKNDSSPVFITPEIEPQYTAGFLRIPEGFLFRLQRDTTYRAVALPRTAVRLQPGTDSYTTALRGIMANALLYRASYESYYGYDSLAALYKQKASEFTANRHSTVSNF
jgi:hypothetical protein